jgi:hypothetical protein
MCAGFNRVPTVPRWRRLSCGGLKTPRERRSRSGGIDATPSLRSLAHVGKPWRQRLQQIFGLLQIADEPREEATQRLRTATFHSKRRTEISGHTPVSYWQTQPPLGPFVQTPAGQNPPHWSAVPISVGPQLRTHSHDVVVPATGAQVPGLSALSTQLIPHTHAGGGGGGMHLHVGLVGDSGWQIPAWPLLLSTQLVPHTHAGGVGVGAGPQPQEMNCGMVDDVRIWHISPAGQESPPQTSPEPLKLKPQRRGVGGGGSGRQTHPSKKEPGSSGWQRPITPVESGQGALHGQRSTVGRGVGVGRSGWQVHPSKKLLNEGRQMPAEPSGSPQFVPQRQDGTVGRGVGVGRSGWQTHWSLEPFGGSRGRQMPGPPGSWQNVSHRQDDSVAVGVGGTGCAETSLGVTAAMRTQIPTRHVTSKRSVKRTVVPP